VLTCAYYAYWRDARPHLPAIHPRPRRLIISFPTNDGLTITVVIAPREEFRAVRADLDGSFRAALDLVADFTEPFSRAEASPAPHKTLRAAGGERGLFHSEHIQREAAKRKERGRWRIDLAWGSFQVSGGGQQISERSLARPKNAGFEAVVTTEVNNDSLATAQLMGESTSRTR
jgi:hypothetical protein